MPAFWTRMSSRPKASIAAADRALRRRPPRDVGLDEARAGAESTRRVSRPALRLDVGDDDARALRHEAPGDPPRRCRAPRRRRAPTRSSPAGRSCEPPPDARASACRAARRRAPARPGSSACSGRQAHEVDRGLDRGEQQHAGEDAGQAADAALEADAADDDRREGLEQHAGAEIGGRAGGADGEQPAGEPGDAPARTKVMAVSRSTRMPARKVAMGLPPIMLRCRPNGVLRRTKAKTTKATIRSRRAAARRGSARSP